MSEKSQEQKDQENAKYYALKAVYEVLYDANDTLTADEKREIICKEEGYTHGLIGLSDEAVMVSHRVRVTVRQAMAEYHRLHGYT